MRLYNNCFETMCIYFSSYTYKGIGKEQKMNKLTLILIVLLIGLMILSACNDNEGNASIENNNKPELSNAPSQIVSPTNDTNQSVQLEAAKPNGLMSSSNLQLKNIDADLQSNGKWNKLELYARVDQYGNPLTWHLNVDGVEKVTLSLVEPGIYGAPADIKVEDIDGDSKPEVLIYRYSMGSAGAIGLNIYSPSKEWEKIFSIENPFEFDENHAKDRYEVKYLGDFKISFIDHQTSLKATIPLDKKKYQDREVKITTWVDPISEFEFKDKDEDGIKEIMAIQRIIGSSHPDTIGLLITSYRMENGEYRIKTIVAHDEQGSLAQKVDLK
jgi:hypothetical protein